MVHLCNNRRLITLSALVFITFEKSVNSFSIWTGIRSSPFGCSSVKKHPDSIREKVVFRSTSEESGSSDLTPSEDEKNVRNIVVVGAGWGGLSVAHHLRKNSASSQEQLNITIIDAAPRVGGVVRDGYETQVKKRAAEAGQHGFWDNYYNIYHFLENDLKEYLDGQSVDNVLTSYAEQGQYSPKGLEAIWPVYRDMKPQLPTGLAQAVYTKFLNLPITDRITAFPLVLAFSEFDDSPEAWAKYDNISFRDLCIKLGVSERLYKEAFESMILTGLFAPGNECSAAAALGMAYFFVLRSQNSFDVRWCKGNIGEKIFQPWVELLTTPDEDGENAIHLLTETRADDFEVSKDDKGKAIIKSVRCSNTSSGETTVLDDVDEVIFAVGASALSSIVRKCPSLASFSDISRFVDLRGTSVLATRLYLDRNVKIPYSANAVFGFDKGVGQTFFDISTLHGENSPAGKENGTVVEVDYYHAGKLLVLSDEEIISKAKSDLDTMLSGDSNAKGIKESKVEDAAIVRLPQAVNWYFPGSYDMMPDAKSKDISNLYFVGDLVRSRHGSWSQEKAYVTGMETANLILKKKKNNGIIPLSSEEPHVKLGRQLVSTFQQAAVTAGLPKPPSFADFFF